MDKYRSENKAIAMNIIWAVLAVGINYAINFATTPYITNNIGVEAYGFVSLATTFTTYIDIISIALNAFASRYISISYHKGDIEKANIYYNSVIVSDIILSILVLIPCTIMIAFLDKVLKIPSNLVVDVKILFLVVLVKYLITVMRTAFSVGAFIKNRLDITERQRSISFCIQGGVLIFLCSILSPHVWYVGIASLMAAAYLLFVYYRNTAILTPDLKFNGKLFSVTHVKNLVSSGVWNAINNLGNILNSGLDLVISNLLLSATVMGQISIAKNLATICYTMVTTIAGSFKPVQTRHYAENNKEQLVGDLKKAMKITGLICNLVIAGFFVYGESFLRLWLSNAGNIPFIYSLSIIVLFSDVIIGVVNPLYYVYTLTDKLKIPCYITLIMGGLNVTSMYILIKFFHMGGYAIVLTTLVLNCVHFVDTPLYSSYCLNIRWYTFYPVILRHILATGINLVVMKFLSSFLSNADSWLMLVFDCLICGIVGVLIGIIVMFDKDEIASMCKDISRRFKLF